MKQFNKTQVKEIEAFRDRLQDQRRVVEEAIEKAQGLINDAIEEANTLRENAAEFIRDLHGKGEDYIGERSDAWLESDAADSYRNWLDAIDTVANELEEEIGIDLIDVAQDQLEAIDSLANMLEEDNLPRAPEQ